MKESIRVGVSQPLEGVGEGLGGAEAVVRVFFRALHGLDVQLGFDDGKAIETPPGGDHLVDQVELGWAEGLELPDI